MLTTVEDVDVQILLNLTFADLQNACQANSYLCKNPIIQRKINNAKSRVENMLKRFDDIGYITLEPLNTILAINYVNYLRIVNANKRDTDNFGDSNYVRFIAIYKFDDNIQCDFYDTPRSSTFVSWYNISRESEFTGFWLTFTQVKQLLLHLVYDEMILLY